MRRVKVLLRKTEEEGEACPAALPAELKVRTAALQEKEEEGEDGEQEEEGAASAAAAAAVAELQ